MPCVPTPSPAAARLRIAALLGAVVIAVVAWCHPAPATVPATMSYQGLLRDTEGSPLPDDQYAFVFRIFDFEEGGTLLWQESQSLTVTGGLFNATLGIVTPLTLPFDAQYWLETTAAGETLSPRVRLASSPYAQRAAVAEALAGGSGSGDITSVYADNGLTGGATSGDAHLSIGAGPGISVTADAVQVDAATLAGSGLVAEGAGTLAVNTGAGLALTSDQVRLMDAYLSGSTYDGRFVNEGQASSVTTEMVAPNIVSSLDGVVNDGGNIDLIAGANVTITPDDANNTITISATGGGGGGIGGSGTTGYVPKFTGSTTIGNSLVYDGGYGVGIGTASPGARLSVVGSTQGSGWVEVRDPLQSRIELRSEASGGETWIGFSRGGAPKAMLLEGTSGLLLSHFGEAGGILLHSTTVEYNTNAAVAARYTGGSTADYVGIRGESVPVDYFGIGGDFIGGYIGARGRVDPTGSGTYMGLLGDVNGGSGVNYGVYAHASGYGVNYAGFFQGEVWVSGNFGVGGSKSFRIDHPLDPANKYLNHFCIESDEILNTYSGNVVLDATGAAWVELADWFEAINRNPRYQLTCIGGYAPVYIAEKIAGNRFKIAGGTPGLEVSWEVTAVRSDPTIEKYRLPAEQQKPAAERGKYLEPELYGAPETSRIGPDLSKASR